MSMKLTIFRRLIIGHLLVLIFAISASAFAIFILGQFENVTLSIRELDDRVLEYEKKLSDTLLSEIQYERKFLIGRDEVLYNRFLLFNDDFHQYLEELLALPASEQTTILLQRVKQSHQQYEETFNGEVTLLKSRARYAPETYRKRKDAATNSVLDDLKQLRSLSEQNVNDKIRTLAQVGANARRLTAAVTLVALILGISVALWTTRSITRPIWALKNRTAEIAQGNLGTQLNLSSPPEIADLAAAFNSMTQQLKNLEKMKAD